MEELNKITTAPETEELITIGPDDGGPTYKVQKQLLLDASDYFVKALSSCFRETTERRIRLPRTAPEAVKLLVYWLGRRRLPKLAEELEDLQTGERHLDQIEEDITRYYLALVRLWVLGEQLMMLKLQDATMKEMLEIVNVAYTTLDVLCEGHRTASRYSTLSKMMVVEAQYEYFEGHLAEEDLEELARLPGFVGNFVDDWYRNSGHFESATVKDEWVFMIEPSSKS